MEPLLLWAILGLALVIGELLTGTFYLLMFGVAAFGAAAVAALGADFGVQALVAGLVAGAGCWGVHLWRRRDAANRMPALDVGQPAAFEVWIDRPARRARVRYRDALWEARVEGEALPEPGSTVYVEAAEGNTLRVSLRRPG